MIKSLYFASPFFTTKQIEREERLKAKLRELKFDVWSPKEMCILKKDASIIEQIEVFNGNLAAMNKVDGVFVVTDDKDIGTIWEAGYAYALKKPIIYYCETLGNNVFNVMLARSGRLVITKFEDINADKIKIVDEQNFDYKGCIE